MKKVNSPGFTLLELIIVIIIVGVLASLSFVRFIRVIEASRAAEALTMIKVIRQSIERCYLMRSSYSSCKNLTWAELGMDDPALTPNKHFQYSYWSSDTPVPYVWIIATRNSYELAVPDLDVFSPRQMCGDSEFLSRQNFIFFCQEGSSIRMFGYNAYQGIK